MFVPLCRTLSILVLFGSMLATGCSNDATVTPPPVERVPADAPVSEEAPSTDEK